MTAKILSDQNLPPANRTNTIHINRGMKGKYAGMFLFDFCTGLMTLIHRHSPISQSITSTQSLSNNQPQYKSPLRHMFPSPNHLTANSDLVQMPKCIPSRAYSKSPTWVSQPSSIISFIKDLAQSRIIELNYSISQSS